MTVKHDMYLCGIKCIYILCNQRMSELVQQRQKSPWLWHDGIYSLLPSGKESKRALGILHDFTEKVRRGYSSISSMKVLYYLFFIFHIISV